MRIASGLVTDDGLPTGAAVTNGWSRVSGPGTATFANAASPATTATFSQDGTYVLRLTASDTLLTAFGTVTPLWTTVQVEAAEACPLYCGRVVREAGQRGR